MCDIGTYFILGQSCVYAYIVHASLCLGYISLLRVSFSCFPV